MSDRDFEIGSRKFKLSKINAMKQFHIVRRIAPILGELAPNLVQISKTVKDSGTTEDDRLEQIAQFVAPVMLGLSKLTDADANLVLMGLLSSVEMKQEATGNWSRVAVDGNLMFDDLELPLLLQAAGRAFMFNMAGFFAVLPQVS